MTFRFDEFELDLSACVLRRAGKVVPLAPRLFDVLRHLVQHRDRVVTKAELLEAVWAPEHVTPSVVRWTIRHLRKALDPPAGRRTPIETVSRRGYRFVAPPSFELEANVRDPAADGRAGVSVPFVGREAALRQLEEGLANACAGRGGLYILVGESGIGKSRCAAQLTKVATSRASVWATSCARSPTMPALWPWAQILRASASEAPVASVLRKESCDLADQLLAGAEEAGEEPLSPPASFLLLDRTARLLTEAAGARPRLLILDDLQASDELALELLLILAPQLHASRMMILATLQEPALDSTPAAPSLLRAVQSAAQRVPLLPWSRAEVQRYLEAFLATEEAQALVEAMWKRTGGNPLFVQELVQLRLTHGDVAELPAAAPGALGLPDAVRTLVRRRLEGLTPETLAVLGAASVVGCGFDLSLLERITERPAAVLLAQLQPALQCLLLQSAAGPALFVFSHELIRDVIYADLAGTERARLHARTGEALEDPLWQTSSALLAWHFYSAAATGCASRAVQYAVRAAREAARVGAHSDEARYYEWALEAQAFDANPDARARCGWLIALGAARSEFGQIEASRQHLARAIQIAQERDFPDLLARAALTLRPSMHLAHVPDPQALSALEQARRRLPPEETALRARVASCLSCIPPHLHSREVRWRLLDEGMQLARAAGDSRSLFDALRARCHALAGPDRVHELLPSAAEILALAATTGSRAIAVEGLTYRYLALLSLGELAQAGSVLEEMERSALELQWREVQWIYRHLHSRGEFYAGRLSLASERYADLKRSARAVRPPFAALVSALGMAHVHLERGTAAAFWSEFTDATRPWRAFSPTANAVTLRMLVAQDRLDEAAAELQRCVASVPSDQGRLGVLAQLSLVACDLGDLKCCAHLYEQLAPFATRNAVDGLWFQAGAVSHFLGILAAALGRRAPARAHFQSALSTAAVPWHRVQTAWTRFELARVLPDTKEAERRHLLQRAVREAQEMGLVSLLDALRRLPRGARRPRFVAGSLRTES